MKRLLEVLKTINSLCGTVVLLVVLITIVFHVGVVLTLIHPILNRCFILVLFLWFITKVMERKLKQKDENNKTDNPS